MKKLSDIRDTTVIQQKTLSQACVWGFYGNWTFTNKYVQTQECLMWTMTSKDILLHFFWQIYDCNHYAALINWAEITEKLKLTFNCAAYRYAENQVSQRTTENTNWYLGKNSFNLSKKSLCYLHQIFIILFREIKDKKDGEKESKMKRKKKDGEYLLQ